MPGLGDGEEMPSPAAGCEEVEELKELDEPFKVDVKDEKRLAAPPALPSDWLGDMLVDEGEVETAISRWMTISHFFLRAASSASWRCSSSRKSKHLRSFFAIKVSKSVDLAPGPMFISLTERGLVPESVWCVPASLLDDISRLWWSRLVLVGVCASFTGEGEGFAVAAAGAAFPASSHSASSSSRIAVNEVRGVPTGLS